MLRARKIFIVVAGGNAEAERHYRDTIKRKRTVDEIGSFLPQNELRTLGDIYGGAQFIVWGAVPGARNETTWTKMEAGDFVLIYNKGHIRYMGEVAAKIRSKELARYFWKENVAGDTWELIYFIVSDQKVDVPIEKLNPLLGYKDNFTPQGFSMVDTRKTQEFFKNYGDLFGVLKTLDRDEAIHHVPTVKQEISESLEETIVRQPTEHTEMQWRLIRLGMLAHLGVWIPRNDQTKQFEGNKFKDHILPEFQELLAVPPTIKNIDVVWKFGPYSIKSAFEIEHSSSVYSGILRLSDLRAETPNSVFPLFIVAADAKRRKVFDELRRPTFSGPCLRLNEVIHFLGYKKLRELDEASKATQVFDPETLFAAAEPVPSL